MPADTTIGVTTATKSTTVHTMTVTLIETDAVDSLLFCDCPLLPRATLDRMSAEMEKMRQMVYKCTTCT